MNFPMTVHRALAAAIWTLSHLTSGAASVMNIELPGDTDRNHVMISGPITRGDDAALSIALKDQRPLTVHLDSPGGDVETAMNIGRLIRRKEATVEMDFDQRCLSACVLLYAAGVTRLHPHGFTVWGGGAEKPTGVGIHRLYFRDLAPNLSQGQVKRRYDTLLRRLRDYFEEMNVAPEFVSYMQSIEPERIHRMTTSELERYGLGQSDVIYSERRVARRAALMGISSAELRVREQRANAALLGQSGECQNLDIIPDDRNRAQAARFGSSPESSVKVDCTQAIKYGIPITLYRERASRLNAICGSHGLSQAGFDCTDRFLATGKIER